MWICYVSASHYAWQYDQSWLLKYNVGDISDSYPHKGHGRDQALKYN